MGEFYLQQLLGRGWGLYFLQLSPLVTNNIWPNSCRSIFRHVLLTVSYTDYQTLCCLLVVYIDDGSLHISVLFWHSCTEPILYWLKFCFSFILWITRIFANLVGLVLVSRVIEVILYSIFKNYSICIWLNVKFTFTHPRFFCKSNDWF